MTSRIQSDSNEKEAKWADIDDDEDDWAPETIEWNDGTKITLGQSDNIASPTQRPDGVKPQAESEAVSESQTKLTSHEGAKLNASKPISSLGPNATVLKLGAHMEKQQAKQIEGSKYPGDRPTLTAKGMLPPSKSPWAPLPPVEKVSPIAVNPALSNQRSSRFFQGDRPGPELNVPSSPTKEIAADDFNRSWRDNSSAAPRELFNSQSGRYEPVQDNRRGPPKPDRSIRNEAHFKPSSLLQRPNHNEQSGPAEPSHAFQTHRSAVDNNTWGRRRTSSNVSGGSGIMGRRMSFSKPDHSLKGRNAPFQQVDPSSNGILEQPTSPRSFHQPKSAQQPSSPSRQPPNVANSGPNNHHYTPPASNATLAQPGIDASNAHAPPPAEDPVALQQRIMREKREMARQRRLEEEAKEEAAKQERIRLKLQSMGVPPEKPTSKEPAKRPADNLAHSPPKPPVPEPSGEPKQYGMMKVHHPESVKKMVASTDRMPEKSHAVAPQSRQVTSPREGKFAAGELTSGPDMNGIKTNESSPNLPSRTASLPQSEDGNLQWKYGVSSGPPYASWSSVKVHAQPPGALWGPPSNDKALGNGTFDRNLTSFPPQDLSARAALGLSDKGPILPAPTHNERREVPDGLAQPLHGAPRGVADGSPSLSPLASPESRAARLNANDHPRPIARPGPIAPPSQVQGQQRRHQDQPPYRSQETTAWNNFHAVASKAEAEENERFHRDLKVLREEEVRSGISPSLQVAFNETWRQVEVGDQAGQRNVVAVTKSLDKDSASQLRQLDSTVPGLSFADTHKPIAPSTRGSRFFPTVSDQKRPGSWEAVSNRSPSPPPPEEISSHPVFTRDFQRPLVHLPNPKPRVKLPPQNRSPSPPPRQQPVTFASMVASPPPARVPAKAMANTPSWQDRFNGLFGKKPAQSPQANKNSLAVASATKEPLDTLYKSSSAAVSFPQNGRTKMPLGVGKVTSKEVEEEEEIFEDREAGSLPVVKVPIMAPKAAWQPAPSPSASRFRSKYQRPVQAHSVEPFFVGYIERDNNNGDVMIVIRFPGKGASKKVPLPKKSDRGQKGGNAPARQQRTSNGKHRRNTKSREVPASHRDSQNLKKGAVTSNNRTGSPKSQQNNSK